MLIELLSMSNYVNFNIKLAEILGLHPAIYLSQIMDINEKALRKDKVNENFFTIDREYITKRTTVPESEQVEIENNLITIGVLERSKDNASTICLNITVLTSILMSPDEDLVKDISNLSKKKQPRKTKAEAIISALQQNIITLNPELRQAYYDWINAVYAKDGFMVKTAVISAQQNLDKFADQKLDVALKVLEIATINGYRDITWAINNYKKDYKVNFTVAPTTPSIPPKKVRLSNDIF